MPVGTVDVVGTQVFLSPLHGATEGITELMVIIVFLALPEATSAEVAPQLLAEGVRVVDLSGAFRLREWVAHSHVMLERNEHYHGRAAVALERVSLMEEITKTKILAETDRLRTARRIRSASASGTVAGSGNPSSSASRRCKTSTWSSSTPASASLRPISSSAPRRKGRIRVP